MSPAQASDLLRVLADPTRLRYLALLHQHGTLCVCELERITGTAQYTVSRNLGILRRVGLVEATRNGARVDYRLCSELTPKQWELVSTVVGLVADHPDLEDDHLAARSLRGGWRSSVG
ncbi:MAG: winged helix-turn-helix transcriptional regulator [Armatimonadetes bacterium]|nr:winged helix-turn-helix transcriptional regulator [Armatimonadota bacterium]